MFGIRPRRWRIACSPMVSEAPAGPARGRRLVLAAMTVANAMILVDQTAVPLALPSIEKQFGVGTQEAQWVLSASLLSLSGLLILGGRLGDLFGRRRVFVIGAVGFSAASVMGGPGPRFWAPAGGTGRPRCGGCSDAAGERRHRQQHLSEGRAREGARHHGGSGGDRRRTRPHHRRGADVGVQLAPGIAGQRAPGHRVPGGHPVGRTQGPGAPGRRAGGSPRGRTLVPGHRHPGVRTHRGPVVIPGVDPGSSVRWPWRSSAPPDFCGGSNGQPIH